MTEAPISTRMSAVLVDGRSAMVLESEADCAIARGHAEVAAGSAGAVAAAQRLLGGPDHEEAA